MIKTLLKILIVFFLTNCAYSIEGYILEIIGKNHSIERNGEIRSLALGLAIKPEDIISLKEGNIVILQKNGEKIKHSGTKKFKLGLENKKRENIDELGSIILSQENTWDEEGLVFPCGKKMHPENVVLAYLTPQVGNMKNIRVEIRRQNPFKKIVKEIASSEGIIVVKDFIQEINSIGGKYSWQLIWKNQKEEDEYSKKCFFELAKTHEIEKFTKQFSQLKNLDDPLTLAIMKTEILNK